MIKRILLILCFLPLIIPLYGWSEFIDEEDEIIESSDSELSLDDEEIDQSPKNKQLEQDSLREAQLKSWLKELESLKERLKANQRIKESVLVSLISKILNYDPDNLEALNTLGTFYLQRGGINLAKIIYTRAMKKHPNSSSLNNNLGVIALKKENKKEAITYFSNSLKHKYNNYQAAANLGTLYIASYEYHWSLDYLSLAYSRGKSYLSIQDPEVLKTGNNYGVALAWNGSLKKAMGLFRELTRHNSHAAVEVLLNYAIILGKDFYRKEAALEVLQKVKLMDKKRKYARRVKVIKSYINSLNNNKKEGK